MSKTDDISRARLESWYHNMWGKCDASLVREHAGEYYLRHDPSGPANKLTGQQYADICQGAMAGRKTADFQFHFVTEGHFVAALGRLIFTDGEQWDWVQLFRVEDGKLAETWLPAMGVNIPLAYPRPENSWHDDAIADQDSSGFAGQKLLIKNWFEDLAAGNDVTQHLAPSVKWHDIHSAHLALSPAELQTRMKDFMQGDTATGLKVHIIEEGDYVAATGVWSLGEDKRRWNWVQVFRIEDGKIAESWLNAIGGTDPSIEYKPESEWDINVLPEDCTRIGEQV